MQKFELFIKNERIKTFRLICLLVVILNCLLFIILLFNDATRNHGIIALLFITLYVFHRIYKCKKSKQAFFFDEWVLFLMMMLWVVEDNYFLAIANMILFICYTAAIDKTVYEFNGERIRQRNFPWKKYTWDQLSNVILKDNILTLDFKNNRLLQITIDNEDIIESNFNDYSKEQLQKHLII